VCKNAQVVHGLSAEAIAHFRSTQTAWSDCEAVAKNREKRKIRMYVNPG
jgi:hypothetical protein